MDFILQKRAWLAGASLLRIVLGSTDASAVVFSSPGVVEYTIPSAGFYDFKVDGADGGATFLGRGGAGAVVGGDLFFGAGDTLEIIVGGAGLSGDFYGGGGGGGSFVFRGASYLDGDLLFAAGGGGGASPFLLNGQPGQGDGGYPGGLESYGGNFPYGSYGGGDGENVSGGFGGGGGGSYYFGGIGGGAPADFSVSAGGFSYVTNSALSAFGITGGNWNGGFEGGANGYVSIDFVAAPEPSTWAMMLIGFAGVGWLARRRKKVTPAGSTIKTSNAGLRTSSSSV